MVAETGFWSGVSFLGLWAIMGPTLAAVISAWWNRKLRNEEREQTEKREQENRESLLADKSKTNLFEIEKKKYELRNQKIVRFFAVLDQYQTFRVKDLSEYVFSKIQPDLDRGEDKRHNLVSSTYELRIILTNDVLVAAINDLHVAVMQLPPYDTPSEQLAEHLNLYTRNVAKKTFVGVELSKKYLDELESDLQNLL